MYLTLSDADKKRLKEFYDATSAVDYLEKERGRELVKGKLVFHLSPVGLQRLPESEDELGRAMFCVGKALIGLHNLGWTHNDMRWLNIIYKDKDWFLIDCEFAFKIGDPLPNNMKLQDPLATTCSISSDIYLYAFLLKDPAFLQFDPKARAGFHKFYDQLENGRVKAKNGLATFMKHPWIARYVS